MLIRLHTTAQAVIRESWTLDVPDDFADDVLRDPANVLRYIAVDADIAVSPADIAIVEVQGRTFDSTEAALVTPYEGRHRAEAL